MARHIDVGQLLFSKPSTFASMRRSDGVLWLLDRGRGTLTKHDLSGGG